MDDHSDQSESTSSMDIRSRSSNRVSFSHHASLNEDDMSHDHDGHRKRSRIMSNQSAQSTVPTLVVELYDLHRPLDPQINAEWVQLGRWIKYEEEVESVDAHFGRPRIPVLSYHSLNLLNKYMMKGVFLLDLDADTFGDAILAMAESFAHQFGMKTKQAKVLMDTFKNDLKRISEERPSLHKFSLATVSALTKNQFLEAIEESRNSSERSLDMSQDAPKRKSATAEILAPAANEMVKRLAAFHKQEQNQRKMSKRHQIAKKLSAVSGATTKTTSDYAQEGADACQVFVGSVPELKDVQLGFVRLSKPIMIPDCIDTIPIRFLIIVIGPFLPDVQYADIGRAVATLMANPIFQEIAYTALDKSMLLTGLQEFMDSSAIIPPSDIYKNDLVHIEDVKKALRNRKLKKDSLKKRKESDLALRKHSEALENGQNKSTTTEVVEVAYEKMGTGKSWDRTGRPFGGLINDFKNRFPLYKSDFKDSFQLQCISATVFMFFVVFSPAISFGQVMNVRLEGYMGITEVFISQCVCGIIWALFSGQPLLIQAATGPFLVFESALFQFCKSNAIQFLPVRIWVGFWTLIIAAIIVLAEGSFLVGYVTRFTEDIFTCLIAGIFIFEAAKFVVGTFMANPLLSTSEYCNASVSNQSWPQSESDHDQPNTAMVSMVLVIATFFLAFILKKIRTSHYFGRTIRKALGDFGVPITILIMVLIAKFGFSNTYLEFINMPSTFGLTQPAKRGWIVHPMGTNQTLPPWIIGAAIIPAILISILLFCEVEITQLLLTSKERGLKKPMGFHWDLLLCAALMFGVSFFGLPWTCAGAVQSLTHAASLAVMKRSAPGEKPTVEYVVEQRVTTLIVAILIGACSFLGQVLKYIPIAVLLGVFLYLGISCLMSVQLIHRIILFFIPRKYFPDLPYSKQVSMWRMHAFTLCQLLGFAILWTVHTIQQSSLAFPFVIALNALARRFLLPRLFLETELKALDALDMHDDDSNEDDADIYDESPLPM